MTFEVVMRKGGVDTSLNYVAVRATGAASAAEHFAMALARLVHDDERDRAGIPADKVEQVKAALSAFDVPPERGLSTEQASAAVRSAGLAPRSMGSWVLRGWVTREDDHRFITDEGREWLSRH
jgi:hypothetical protein